MLYVPQKHQAVWNPRLKNDKSELAADRFWTGRVLLKMRLRKISKAENEI